MPPFCIQVLTSNLIFRYLEQFLPDVNKVHISELLFYNLFSKAMPPLKGQLRSWLSNHWSLSCKDPLQPIGNSHKNWNITVLLVMYKHKITHTIFLIVGMQMSNLKEQSGTIQTVNHWCPTWFLTDVCLGKLGKLKGPDGQTTFQFPFCQCLSLSFAVIAYKRCK